MTMRHNTDATDQAGNGAVGHWLALYERDITHAANRLIHRVCAPLFFVSLLGILWCIPVPGTLEAQLAALNWATLFAMATVVYYFVMSITLALGSLPFIAASLGGMAWLEQTGAPLLTIASVVFLVASLGQFIGYRLQSGGSLLHDLLYCVIGPIWVLAALYRRLGIPY